MPSLPERASLDQLRKLAKELGPPLHAAQRESARRYGFASWARLKRHVELARDHGRYPADAVDTGPEDAFLRAACLTYTGADHPDRRAAAGDLMYRPAVSYAAQTVERHLHVPGVADFYVMPDGVFFPFAGGLALHQRLGVSCPAAIPCHTNDPTLVRAFAERLGGPPLVVKVPVLL